MNYLKPIAVETGFSDLNLMRVTSCHAFINKCLWACGCAISYGIIEYMRANVKLQIIIVDGNRYIVCFNTRQARKDVADRQAITDSLQEKIEKDPKALIGNKGYRKYLRIDRDHIAVDQAKIEADARLDGKWVLKTTTGLSPEQVALKYKELWLVEHVFRDMKSILETRPVFHQEDETIRGHVFCSFLALTLRKELQQRLEAAGNHFEWSEIKQDIKSLQEIVVEDIGKTLAIRSECKGVCGKVFESVGVAIPPTIREVQ